MADIICTRCKKNKPVKNRKYCLACSKSCNTNRTSRITKLNNKIKELEDENTELLIRNDYALNTSILHYTILKDQISENEKLYDLLNENNIKYEYIVPNIDLKNEDPDKLLKRIKNQKKNNNLSDDIKIEKL